MRVLASLSVPETHPAVQALGTYTFEHACAHLVASWPLAPVARGWHEIKRVGLGRLAHVVRHLGTPKHTRGLQLEAQGSSLAAYYRRWLEQFYLVASGMPLTRLLPLPSHRGDGASPDFVRVTGDRGLPNVRILFPTQRWVEHESVEGPIGGGCFFGKVDDFHKRALHELYAQPVSHRGQLMMHAKSLLATYNDPPTCGWVYLGSANFTRAAWGTISGSREQPTLSVSNWELGVVFPLDSADVNAMDAVPYRRPVTPYAPRDTPWDVRSLGAWFS